MSYPTLLAQLAISGTLAGATRLRLQRCFTVATLCITLTAVLERRGLERRGQGLERRGQGLERRVPAVI
jgi:uncharacterized membrane protein